MSGDPFANVRSPEEPPQRPVIITVFAIFTIIGCAMAILGAFIPTGLFTRDLTYSPPQPPAWIGYVGALLAVMKLVGALQMLKMRRIGFFLYAAGESASAIISIVSARIVLDLMAGFDMPGPIDLNLILIITTGVNLLLSVVFIAVYGSQLKNMR